MKYDVTISITTYNEEKYIPILLNSIKNQDTNLKIEIIVIDDQSTDNTINIVKSYNDVRIINNDRKSDVQYMRNTGLKEANGKVIIFCDADVALSKNYIENMVRPIIENKVDTTLCKTYAILEGFYDILPEKYSKSYVYFLKHSPKIFLKRFPVQFLPWIKLWLEMMKTNKKFISIWNVPNRAHTTGIATKTEIARKAGGWRVQIGDGDDAKYSYDIFENSSKVLWVSKTTLYISRRRVFPTDNSWIFDIFFKDIKKLLKKYSKKNDYSKNLR